MDSSTRSKLTTHTLVRSAPKQLAKVLAPAQYFATSE